MVERLRWLVCHRDGAELGEGSSLELLQQSLSLNERLRKPALVIQAPPSDELPGHVLTELVVRGVLFSFPQRRPRCGAACEQNHAKMFQLEIL